MARCGVVGVVVVVVVGIVIVLGGVPKMCWFKTGISCVCVWSDDVTTAPKSAASTPSLPGV